MYSLLRPPDADHDLKGNSHLIGFGYVQTNSLHGDPETSSGCRWGENVGRNSGCQRWNILLHLKKVIVHPES